MSSLVPARPPPAQASFLTLSRRRQEGPGVTEPLGEWGEGGSQRVLPGRPAMLRHKHPGLGRSPAGSHGWHSRAAELTCLTSEAARAHMGQGGT